MVAIRFCMPKYGKFYYLSFVSMYIKTRWKKHSLKVVWKYNEVENSVKNEALQSEWFIH